MLKLIASDNLEYGELTLDARSLVNSYPRAVERKLDGFLSSLASGSGGAKAMNPSHNNPIRNSPIGMKPLGCSALTLLTTGCTMSISQLAVDAWPVRIHISQMALPITKIHPGIAHLLAR